MSRGMQVTILALLGVVVQIPRLPPPQDRTTARLEALTPAQRYHSTLFPEFHSEGNRMLDSLMSRSTITHSNLSSPPKPLAEFLRDSSCDHADRAVFLGVNVSGEAFPIDDGSFLFTDHHVRLLKVFKSPFGRVLTSGESVVVGRAGGELVVDGARLWSRADSNPLLTFGSTYLFFALHHREFKTFHTKAQVFLADGQKLSAVAREFAPITEDPMSIDQQQVEKLLSAVSACRNQ